MCLKSHCLDDHRATVVSGRWEMVVSFVVAAPEQVQAAAENLAGIRSMLAEASASVAVPTTGVVPAAADEVSAAIAAMFANFGQEYQFLSAQAEAFHAEFVNLLSAGAGAYLSTEIANAEQNLLNAVNGPIQGLLGQSIGGASSGAVEAAAAARSAALPVLGGLVGGTPVGSILGGAGTSVGQSLGGVVTALENGSAASLLSGHIGAGLQTLSGNIAGLPAAVTGLDHALAPGLLQTGAAASTSLATIEGPYQTLFANTVTNLQTLGSAISAHPAPFLHQFIINQIGYAQTIAAGVEYVIQNLPAVLASLPANIQAAIHTLLAFNPVPYIQQFIAQQLTYAQIIATSLQNAAHDFVAGLQELPAAFQSAVQALMAGDINGAVSDIAQGFLGLFVTGVDVTITGDIFVAPGLTATVTPTGTLGDLLPILTIPGMMAQNFTNLLPPGSIPAQISQNFTNVINTLTDTSITAHALVGFSTSSPFITVSLTETFGLPEALTIDALGAPVDAAGALGSSATAFVDELQTANPIGAIGTLIDAPAVVTNAFLNGQSTLPLTFSLVNNPPTNVSATINLPLDGILVPQTPLTLSVTGSTAITIPIPPFPPIVIPIGPVTLTVPVGGTPISGLATGLLVFAPEQLALAITP